MTAASAQTPEEAAYRAYLDFDTLVTNAAIHPLWSQNGRDFQFISTIDNRLTLSSFVRESGVSIDADLSWLRDHMPPATDMGSPSQNCESPTLLAADQQCALLSWAGQQHRIDLRQRLVIDIAADTSKESADTAWRFHGVGRRVAVPPCPAPANDWLAAIEYHNIVVTHRASGARQFATNDGNADVFWDLDAQPSIVWSPDGAALVAVKRDISGLPVTSLTNLAGGPPFDVIRLAAGAMLPHETLVLINPASGQTHFVDLGDTRDAYVRTLGWAPSGAILYAAKYDRQFKRVEIHAVAAKTGAATCLFTETSDSFLSWHERALVAAKPDLAVLPDDRGLLWISERSGRRDIYHYDLVGNCHGLWTQAEGVVEQIDHVAADGAVYFTARSDPSRPYDIHLFKAAAGAASPDQLSDQPGTNSFQFAPSGELFIHTNEAIDRPPAHWVRGLDGRLLAQLAGASTAALAVIGYTPAREYRLAAADGKTEIWSTVFLPFDFDARRRYPVVEYIYGGPQYIWRPARFSFGGYDRGLMRELNFPRALANLGFVVVITDARGTPGRSKAFQDVVHRAWGTPVAADHRSALEQLARQEAFVDLDRVAVMGISWGAQFALRAMLQYPAIYKAGICEMPLFDNASTILSEPFLGLPEDHPDLYAQADIFAQIDALQGRLMIVTAMQDEFGFDDAFRLSSVLVSEGKDHRFMAYASGQHTLLGSDAMFNVERKRDFLVAAARGAPS